MEKELLEHVDCEDEDMDTHARSLLENIGGIGAARKLARKNMAEKFQEAAEKYQRDAQEQFEALQKDAQHGCYIGVTMDIVLFVGGFLLVLAAIVLLLGMYVPRTLGLCEPSSYGIDAGMATQCIRS
eukprot:scaffold8026_cov444-Prasinococcus_capsulatus_cf.AAC.4